MGSRRAIDRFRGEGDLRLPHIIRVVGTIRCKRNCPHCQHHHECHNQSANFDQNQPRREHDKAGSCRTENAPFFKNNCGKAANYGTVIAPWRVPRWVRTELSAQEKIRSSSPECQSRILQQLIEQPVHLRLHIGRGDFHDRRGQLHRRVF